MIKVIEHKKEYEPCYRIIFRYSIADSCDNSNEECIVSTNFSYLETIITILNRLRPASGKWGIMLNNEELDSFLEEEQISKEEYDLLFTLFNFEYVEKISPQYDNDDMYNLYTCIKSDDERVFFVFNEVELYYVDDYGIYYETEIVND